MASKILKIVKKIDANSRAVAKLVSAMEYCEDAGYGELELLKNAKFTLIQQRRNLRADLEDELKRQPNWNNGRKRRLNGKTCYACGAEALKDNRCTCCRTIQDERLAVPA